MDREIMDVCLGRIELALGRGNRDECYAAIDAAFSVCVPEPVTLDSPVEAIGIPTVSVTFLRRAGIRTVRELTWHTASGLCRIRRIGPCQAAEIIEAMDRLGYPLAEK